MLAGQALSPNGPADGPADPDEPTPRATPTVVQLPAAPLLALPAVTLTREAAVSLSGQLVEDLPRDAGYRLRVYVNGEKVRERRLPRRADFTIADVPLVEGVNSITLAIGSAAGESLHSAPVLIERDSTAPLIELTEPANGAVVYGPSVTLRGTSEPGASLSVTNRTTSRTVALVVADDGSFEAALELLTGFNELALESRDAAGNEASARLTIERREGAPSVRLALSRTTIDAASLPVTISLEATVRDASGAPIDGAEAFFSLSPPGMPTITFSATTVGGVARWPSVRISTEAQPGQGLATVLVTLPGGETLTESAYFTIE
ncbi:MAG TPA: hypothetical protein VH741_04975 [Candidatus Limnocylindrales bacterium]